MLHKEIFVRFFIQQNLDEGRAGRRGQDWSLCEKNGLAQNSCPVFFLLMVNGMSFIRWVAMRLSPRSSRFDQQLPIKGRARSRPVSEARAAVRRGLPIRDRPARH